MEINIEGNDIEYFAICTFAALRSNGFTNLIVLNGKDYSRWDKKMRQKIPSMKSVYSSMKKLEKDMGKTLKRTVRNNVQEKYRAHAAEELEDEDYQTTSRVSEKSNNTNGR